MKRNILLNPGPATTTDSVKRAMLVPDICPREKEFVTIMKEVRQGLLDPVRAGPEYTCVLFAGSGTAAVDAVLNSVVPGNGGLLVINNGAYGERMAKIAKAYSLPHSEIRFEKYLPADPAMVEREIDRNPNLTHVAMVHHETTTGVLNPLEEIAGLCKANGKALIVDAISSFAGIPIDLSKSSVDFLISSSNKCIQGMAGVSFVIGRRSAIEASAGITPRSFYLNLVTQFRYFEEHGEMQFTPPVQVIYALRQAIREFKKEGARTRAKRYIENWTALRKGLRDLGLAMLVDEKYQSHILTTVMEPDHSGFSFDRMHDLLYARGFTIYPGKIGERKTFRIANMGAIDKRDIAAFVKALGDVLGRMGVVRSKKTKEKKRKA